MTKFISVTWSEGVTEKESQTFTNIVERTLKWLYMRRSSALADPPIRMHVFGNWVIPALVPDRPYWGTQWYIGHELRSRSAAGDHARLSGVGAPGALATS